MGCDIHLFVEVYDRERHEWRMAPGQLSQCHDCRGTGVNWIESLCRNCNAEKAAHVIKDGVERCLFGSGEADLDLRPCYYCSGGARFAAYYSTRNYALFGVLAGVRHPSVAEFTKEDVGLPEDLSTDLEKYMGPPGQPTEGLHSQTWYSLGELLIAKEVGIRWNSDELQASDFERNVIDCMKGMAVTKNVSEDEVRCVMAFDN